MRLYFYTSNMLAGGLDLYQSSFLFGYLYFYSGGSFEYSTYNPSYVWGSLQSAEGWAPPQAHTVALFQLLGTRRERLTRGHIC